MGLGTCPNKERLHPRSIPLRTQGWRVQLPILRMRLQRSGRHVHRDPLQLQHDRWHVRSVRMRMHYRAMQVQARARHVRSGGKHAQDRSLQAPKDQVRLQADRSQVQERIGTLEGPRLWPPLERIPLLRDKFHDPCPSLGFTSYPIGLPPTPPAATLPPSLYPFTALPGNGR